MKKSDRNQVIVSLRNLHKKMDDFECKLHRRVMTQLKYVENKIHAQWNVITFLDRLAFDIMTEIHSKNLNDEKK